MIDNTKYTEEEIRKFLEISESSYKDEDSVNLKKLMTVKDRISIFKNLKDAELKAIIYNLKFIKYSIGDTIIKENETSHEIFYIITGICKVTHNTKEIGILKAGQVFGEAGAIFDIKRNATVETATHDVTLLSFCIDHNNMEFCSQSLATLYKNLAFQINKKLQKINNNYTLHRHI